MFRVVLSIAAIYMKRAEKARSSVNLQYPLENLSNDGYH